MAYLVRRPRYGTLRRRCATQGTGTRPRTEGETECPNGEEPATEEFGTATGWRGSVELGTRPDGERIRKDVTGRTKAVVLEKLAAADTHKVV